MAKRPLGIYLACGFFVLIGLASIVSGLSSFSFWEKIPSGSPLTVEVFFYVFPFFMLGLGILGVVASVGLWGANSYGRTTGLVWSAVWVGEELLLAVWGEVGPEMVQRAASGIGVNIVRAAAAAVLFYYLWTVGERYVEGQTAVVR